MIVAACGSSDDDWDGNQLEQRHAAIYSGNRMPENQCNHRPMGGGISSSLWYYLGRNSMLPYHGGFYSRTAYTTTPPTSRRRSRH